MNNPGAPPLQNILTGQTERIASVSSNNAVRAVAKLTVGCTFLLLVAGALVTGNKAALSDPTWPLFLGHIFPVYWTGGLLYENSFRLVEAAVILLTLAMAVLVQVKEPRRFMKKLAWVAFALVIGLAMFGGLVIHSVQHPLVSMAHGIMAHAFFCITVALAVYSSRTWFRDFTNASIVRAENLSYLKLMKIVIALVFLQVIMGTGVRHSNDSGDMFLPFLMAHIAGAFSVIIIVTWFCLRTWQVYHDVAPLRRTAVAAGVMVGLQIILGVLAIFANRARLEPEVANLHHVLTSTAHLLNAASLLALFVGSFVRARLILDRTDYSHLRVQAYQPREVNA